MAGPGFQNGSLGDIAGVLIVYVDDLAFLGPEDLCREFIKTIKLNWKTSDPEWISKDPVTFCGIELSRDETGYRMSQRSYIQELLSRYSVEEEAGTPITKWVEPECKEDVIVDQVREAQGITGALLWLSTRTRPDLAYVVARCGQQATKSPRLSITLGRQALAYLKSTLDMGIDVPFTVGNTFSDHNLLSLPRADRVLELYTDASHCPSGDRSMQSVFIVWRGVPLAWESTRQSFTTLSSAESELVCMVHGVQMAEAVQPLVDELVEQDSLVSLLADNEAAIRAFEASPAGWRNRHLRMRAHAGRERIAANLLKVSHLPGEYQVADLGTKPLSRPRMFKLLELINIRIRTVPEGLANDARLLSRLSLDGVSSVNDLAKTLAGLALLAMLPRAKGQPLGDYVGIGFDWVLWTIVGLLLVAASVWGWWWGFGEALVTAVEVSSGRAEGDAETLSDEGFHGSCEEVGPQQTSDPSSGSSLIASDPVQPETSDQCREEVDGADDVFSEAEWALAQAKLEAIERETGLTFVQRARVRRALESGGVLDPPTFLQRFGPVPQWALGFNSSEEASSSGARSSQDPGSLQHVGERNLAFGLRAVDSSGAWVRVLGLCWAVFARLLGTPAWEWTALSGANQALSRDAALRLIRQLQDTGVQIPGCSEARGSLGATGQIGGSSNSQDPQDSTGQIGGSSSSQDHQDSAGQIGGSSSSQDHQDSAGQIGGSSSSQDHQDSAGQIGGSSSSQNVWNPARQQGGGSEGSSHSGSSQSARGIVQHLNHSSRSEESEGVGLPRPLASGSEGQGGVTTPRVQVGGSSGSHGMQVARSDFASGGLTYEDYLPLGEREIRDTWPYVGTWLQIHYLAQILSLEGERVLAMLGVRSAAWFLLRGASQMIRLAVAGSVVDTLRRGPYSVMFSSPQWLEAVEEYLRTGYPVEDVAYFEEPQLSRDEHEGEEAERGSLGFPYIEWPPGVRVHYLWTVFSTCGALVLDLLGNRVSSWGYLRAVATGFRSSVTLALVVWLRRTHHLYVARAQDTYNAAAAYLQGEGIQYPFGERVEEPQAPGELFEASSSESESSEGSTTEPSMVSLSRGSTVAVEDQDPGGPGSVLRGGEAVTSYEAAEGVLWCTYADDTVPIPLKGWSVFEVQTIVTGLTTGDWRDFQLMMAQGDSSTEGSELPSSSTDIPRRQSRTVFLVTGERARVVWRLVLVVLWLFWGCVKAVEAASDEPWGPQETQCARDASSQVLVVRSQVQDVSIPWKEGCDGSTIWELGKVVLIILTWETAKVCCRACHARRAVF